MNSINSKPLRLVAALRAPRLRGRGDRGVTLAEFAIVFPIFVTVFFSMIEFGFAFNAVLGINRASQNGALIAGQAGSDTNADCMILKTVEEQLQAPLDKRHVTALRIVRASTTGSGTLASNVYTRTGSKNCGDYSVPYTASSTGYPESQRCDVLNGCPTLSPPRSTVDKIAVEITYRHEPVTPMRTLISLIGGNGSTGFDWTFSKRNVSRMEPVQ
jgi:Flp pilus assembly protein TadG